MIYSEFPTCTLSVLDFLPGTHFSTLFFVEKLFPLFERPSLKLAPGNPRWNSSRGFGGRLKGNVGR